MTLASRAAAPRAAPTAPRAESSPRYLAVKEYVLERIENGEWQPDQRIPSENDLVRSFKVSRMTVNRALRELAAEGHVRRVQGLGTYVAESKAEVSFIEVRNIVDELRDLNRAHGCRVLLLREETATPNLAHSFEVPPGSRLFHSILLHSADAHPILLEDRFVRASVVPDYLDQDFTKVTPNEILTRAGAIQEGEHVIEAVTPERRIARLLQMSSGEPCLVLHRRTWTRDVIVTVARLYYPSSRYRMVGRFRPR